MQLGKYKYLYVMYIAININLPYCTIFIIYQWLK